MLIKGHTDQLFDMIIKYNEKLFEGQREFTICIELLPTLNKELVNNFLDLIEEGINNFGANVEIEVIDTANIIGGFNV